MKCRCKLGKKDFLFLIAGLVAGAANGFFGGGGGSILVPMLTKKCGLEPKTAFATSVAVIAPVCAVSAAVYAFRGELEGANLLPYALGGLLGGAAGGVLLKKVKSKALTVLFGALMVLSGVRILWVA